MYICRGTQCINIIVLVCKYVNISNYIQTYLHTLICLRYIYICMDVCTYVCMYVQKEVKCCVYCLNTPTTLYSIKNLS